MVATAVRSIGSIQPAKAQYVPAEPTENNKLERLMAQVHDPEHQAVVQVLTYRIGEAEKRIDRVGDKVDALGDKIDAAQAERTAALHRRPWYSEPSFHLAIVAAVLAAILTIQALGPENTAKAIDRIAPTQTGG